MKSKLILMLLALLGFSACDSSDMDGTPPPMPMYAPPSVSFKVTGKVTNSAGAPINGIKVLSEPGMTETAPDGSYELTWKSFPSLTQHVTFLDQDGVENGGDFEVQRVNLDLTPSDKDGFEKKLDVSLELTNSNSI
ncbi:MAG: radical SAM-associated putative lipoprotein [Alistipes sp.]